MKFANEYVCIMLSPHEPPLQMPPSAGVADTKRNQARTVTCHMIQNYTLNFRLFFLSLRV